MRMFCWYGVALVLILKEALAFSRMVMVIL